MNCREFTIEFEERGTLSEPATLHLTICADCKQMSARQTQIWLLIDGLKPIAAPSDFDFHVKAKIANAKPSDFQSPRFLPVLRYVLPLSVVILLFGLFAYNSAYFSGNSTASQIAKTETSNVNIISSVNAFSNDQIARAPSNEDKIIVKPATINQESLNAEVIIPDTPKTELKKPVETADLNPNRLNKLPKAKTESDSGVGSRTATQTQGKIILPRGMNPNSNNVNNLRVEAPKQIGDEQLLSFLGIETVLENGKRTVKVMAKDKTGELSGVKVGDVIEQINGSVLTVRRGTEKLEITLRNDFNQKP